MTLDKLEKLEKLVNSELGSKVQKSLIENQEIFMIFLIALTIMLIAGIYPSIYASKIPILKSLNYNK